MAAKEQAGPYVPSPCKRCGGAPVLEYNGQYRSAIRSRMRCPACAASPCRRFQAEMEWEEECA